VFVNKNGWLMAKSVAADCLLLPAVAFIGETDREAPSGSSAGIGCDQPEAPDTERITSSMSKPKPIVGRLKKTDANVSQAKLLSGGNPQIAKADGEAPVQAYIAAMPGWKREIGKRLDALIVRNVPKARKAVKWNSPFYGIDGQGWFLSFHVFTKYVKVTFFKGTSLKNVPPGGTGKGRALDRYSRRRETRRGADGDVGKAGCCVARLGRQPTFLKIVFANHQFKFALSKFRELVTFASLSDGSRGRTFKLAPQADDRNQAHAVHGSVGRQSIRR
jgi:hypothetical protein